MVHRPRYDDWSFPKGKVEPGEPLPVCAVREVAEETGARIRLGRPLPSVSYHDADGVPKTVAYWAATVLHTGRRTAPPREIDAAEWVPLSRAADRLTAPSDKAPLDELARFAADGTLDTVPLIVVRHATARPRDSWTRADADRPLVDAGRRQAKALTPLLECWHPESIVSSPWKRCRQTIAPYVDVARVTVRTKGGLSERGFRRDAGKATKHVLNLIDRMHPAALCTHRPVLAGVMATLAGAASADARADVPTESPFLAPSEILVAHLRRGSGGRAVVAVERHHALER